MRKNKENNLEIAKLTGDQLFLRESQRAEQLKESLKTANQKRRASAGMHSTASNPASEHDILNLEITNHSVGIAKK